jgi:hypothetical protein
MLGKMGTRIDQGSLQMTNILDTVEPDSIADGFDRDVPLYSRETVERLLAEHRKQVLLEAAEVCEPPAYPNGISEYRGGWADAHEKLHKELRRMAEGEK